MSDWQRIDLYDYDTKEREKTTLSAHDQVTELVDPKLDMSAVYIVARDGLFGGCCGSPYLGRDEKVIAIHLVSADESLTIPDAITRAHAHWNSKLERKRKRRGEQKEEFSVLEALKSPEAISVTESYASMKFGLILSKIPTFVKAYRNLFGTELNSDFK
jgi:hypothetical protein